MEATITISRQTLGNDLLQDVFDNLDSFLLSINSLRDAYCSNEETLSVHLDKQRAELAKLHGKCTVKEEDGIKIISVPNAEVYHYQKLYDNVLQAERAQVLVPPSYLMAIVSAYDAFFGGIVRAFYNIKPEKLRESAHQFTYRELENLQSLKDVKKMIVDKKIEDLLRESHVAQLDWLAQALDLTTLNQFVGFTDFVEITQRRNLFAHADGIISEQYATVCRKYGTLADGITIGAKLNVDRAYFENAYNVLYRVGIMLTFTMLNILFKDASEEDRTEMDEKLIVYIYNMIYMEKYAESIIVSKFALGPHFKHNSFNKGYYILNLAQSYKWLGDHAACVNVLNEMDWSACAYELLMPRHALLGEFDKACEYMLQIGASNKKIKASSYKEWPIFKELRNNEQFKQTYAKIFGEPFDAKSPLIIKEDVSSGEETQVRDESAE